LPGLIDPVLSRSHPRLGLIDEVYTIHMVVVVINNPGLDTRFLDKSPNIGRVIRAFVEVEKGYDPPAVTAKKQPPKHPVRNSPTAAT
jgi:hypothetical protein